ncbi:MAG: CaiB/BaiF CoA transferase family protein [Acidimicrobiales bacterium]
MGALDNIRVVDFGHFVAGPVAGMLLADQGADVIKIDPPGGPRFVTEANATWNRGKRSITLDLKNAEDLAIAKSLVARADVLIENFRPGVMEQLGLGESDVRPGNQGLIYNSMPAFGPEDNRSAVPGWEGVVLAAADCFRPASDYRDMVQQLHRKPTARAGSPTFTAEPMASMFAAIISALGITSALSLRDRTAQGQRVEVPLFDAVIQSAGIYAMAQLPFKPAFGSAMNPWDHQYKCADGRWIQIVCNGPDHAKALAELVGRPDFIERGMIERRLPDTASEHELIIALTEIFGSKTGQEWDDELREHGLPAALCRSGAEWLDNPHSMAARLLVDLEDASLGTTRQPAPLVELSQAGSEVEQSAPLPDQHRSQILEELANSKPLEKRSTSPTSPVLGPLHGIRVLDLGTSLAGPACGRTLAELGAQVIKIDDPNRGGVLYHHDVNRGKRSILLNLDSDDGHDLFWDLLGTADVVIENLLPGEAKELEIDYETIRAERPDIIYASLSTYGEGGPLSDLVGSDETVQAITGMQVRLGGPERPAIWPYGMVNDYATGYAAAFGVVLAVLERDRSDEGQRIDASLAKTAGMLQSMFLIGHDEKQWTEPAGPMALGFGPTQSLYRCDDGWIFLGADGPKQLEPILGPSGPDDLGPKIAEWCEQRSTTDAVEHLIKHGMGAHELAWLNDAMSDPVVVRRGLSVIREHGSIGLLRTNGPGPWFSRSMVATGSPASLPGSDAASVLAEINRAGEIDELARAGTIKLPDQD